MNGDNLVDLSRPADVTPEWLTDVLKCAGVLEDNAVVSRIDFTPFGTGQSGESIRFVVEYEPSGESGPATLVAKFASADAGARKFAAASGFYEREVRFYRELSQQLPVRAPKPLRTFVAADGETFMILLEDLAPATVVDQLIGCSRDQAALGMEQAAALHAGSWRRTELQRASWLRTTSEAIRVVAEELPVYYTSYVDRYGGLFPEHAMRTAREMVVSRAAWVQAAADPICLWHQDYRSDNMLFDAASGSVGLAVVDWQTIGMGPGMADVSYFLGTSLTTEDRRASEYDLLKHYHHELVARGVEEYDFDQCWTDYRRNVAQAVFTVIHASVRAARTPRGDAMWESWADRSAIQAEDLETFSVLGVRG